jgi:hypothetical protein
VLHTLGRVHDPFDCQALRIQQPRKLLPNRASYEIFSEQRQLLGGELARVPKTWPV